MKFFLATLLLASVVHAAHSKKAHKPSDPCSIAKIKEQEAALASENLANEYTTKTETGGAYERKYLKCVGDNCLVKSEKKFIKRFMPGHPDADVKGFVNFPRVDAHIELAKLLKASELAESAKAQCTQ